MSKDRGSVLPDELLQFLSTQGPPEKFQQVILFTTMDPEGWPRHGMLSLYEIVARSPSRVLMLLYASSKSTENLKREGKLSLIVVNPDMSYYVLCSASRVSPIPEAPHEELFELKVERVWEDALPTAQIVTGLTFEGYDPGMTKENRQLVFGKLQEL